MVSSNLATGTSAPRPPKNDFERGLFEDFELGDCPTQASIDEASKTLWTDPADRVTAIELILGRPIDAGKITGDFLMRTVFPIDSPDHALNALRAVRSIEDAQVSDK